MQFDIIKSPLVENDDMLVRFSDVVFDWNKFLKLIDQDEYLKLKVEKFTHRDISFRGFEKFRARPSLRNIDEHQTLRSTIYTEAVGQANNLPYESCIKQLQRELVKNPQNRRLILHFLNPFYDYLESNDVSCLAFLHYFYNNNKLHIRIVYRATDIKNEFFYDLWTIYYYFVHPIVNGSSVDITFYASTAQNIEDLDVMCNKFCLLGES